MNVRSAWALAGALIMAVFAAASDDASAYSYKTARGLYRDCNADLGSSRDALTRHQHCSEYPTQMLDAWNLDQTPGVSSRRSGDERKRGLGFLSGEFRSAESSVIDFFNGQKQRARTRVSADLA